MERLDPKQIQEALRIAKSPAGQQLLRHLQQHTLMRLLRSHQQASR